MAFNDKTGWKRGAGPYSRSYAKIAAPAEFKLYAKNRDYPGGKDIHDKVRAAGPRKEVLGGDVVGSRGFSNEVSRGKRPVHKAGKRSYKRV